MDCRPEKRDRDGAQGGIRGAVLAQERVVIRSESGSFCSLNRNTMKLFLFKLRYLLLLFAGCAWLRAAPIDGQWTAEFNTQVGVQKYVFTFSTGGDGVVVGKATWERMEQKGETELKDVKVEGENVAFIEMVSVPDMELRLTYTGKLAGDELKLTRQVGDFATEELVAKRVAVPPQGQGPQTKFVSPGQPTSTEAEAAKIASTPPFAAGPFKATWDSLVRDYQCPEWFRDAKFGIWAHWTAQCVPEQGDWYARDMYIQGTKNHQYHVAHYGHPSTFGFMELDNLWKADKWEPEKLMALYKRAGAKYFVALANHHDNFDAYDSKYQPWNSVNVGPKKDIVGTWAKAARAHGLRFGVSNHSSHTWHWFQPAYGHDVEGDKAGVPYDAAKLTKADGKGTWWEGLDPQDLYGGLRIPMADTLKTAREAQTWHRQHDGHWYETVPPFDNGYAAKWYLRTQDLLDKYHPDLLYFDDTELPLEQYGLAIAAHFYNANRTAHGGKLEAVLNAKHLKPEHAAAVVSDIERGVAEGIRPQSWQTDTCIGSWHYERRLFEQHKYKTTAQVVRMLVDIVSKNGNLLLSVPVRGDGTIDEDEVNVLEGMARWMDVNAEAIFGTRPWAVYGEGPSAEEKSEGGQFGGARDVRRKPYTGEDIRFTQKGDDVYAVLMEWPENKSALVKSLAENSAQLGGRKVTGVALLGHPGKLTWSQDAAGLHVTFPDSAPCEHAFVLKIATSR